MTSVSDSVQASTPQLLKATAGALLLATAILLTTVLPAEYGLDPTGIGQMLGLKALSASAEAKPSTAAEAVPAALVVKRDTPFQTSTMSLVLEANQGAEIKALMRAGETFVFNWSTDGGPVNFDMHGEKPNAGDEFTSYWKEHGKTSGHGSFTAPFDGSHGWYWKNKGSEPVTIRVTVSGWFERLYMP